MNFEVWILKFPSGTLGSMEVNYDGYNWLVRLSKGELLVENLTELVISENIGGGWVSGIGAALDAELGYYDLENKTYNWKRMNQLLEITSLQGNIAWDGDKPVIHLHGTFSNEKMQAFGGHVRELQVAGTVEVMIHKWYGEPLTRNLDKDTGLKRLEL